MYCSTPIAGRASIYSPRFFAIVRERVLLYLGHCGETVGVEVRLRHRGEVGASCCEMKIMKMPFYVYTSSDDGSRGKTETV